MFDIFRKILIFILFYYIMYKEQENQEFKQFPDSKIEKYKLREISNKQAEQEIIDYIREHEGTDAYDVAIALKFCPETTIKICYNLVKLGTLEYLS
jgi:hypothetical protein